MGPCPPPPLRPVGLLRGLGRKTRALSWSCLDHYSTTGGGLKTALLVPPPPANRPLYKFELQYLLSSCSWMSIAGIKNFTVTVQLPATQRKMKGEERDIQLINVNEANSCLAQGYCVHYKPAQGEWCLSSPPPPHPRTPHC
jgi:hypothetical protein